MNEIRRCQKCGAQLAQTDAFCQQCGSAAPEEQMTRSVYFERTAEPQQPPQQTPAPQYQQPQQYRQPTPQINYQPRITDASQLPQKFKPIKPWGYVGYSILFALPIIGIICLIIFALSDSNINRRNLARSYFCVFLITIVIAILVAVLVATGVMSADFQSQFK